MGRIKTDIYHISSFVRLPLKFLKVFEILLNLGFQKTEMADKTKFIEELNAKYQPKGEYIVLGKGMLDGEVITEVDVNIPLKTINRHGLIAGATGTGKTKTLQVL